MNTELVNQILKDNGLSPRELDVATHAVAGLRNQEIAEKLFIGEGTVKYHLTNVFRKFNVTNRWKLMKAVLPTRE